MRRIIRTIETVSEYSGRWASWLCVVLVLVLTYETTARYVFDAPTVWAHVTATMLYGSIGMLGLAYTHLHDGHIRVDLLYARLSVKARAILDAVLSLIGLFPLLYVLIKVSYFFVVRSWAQHEVMMESFWYPPASPFRTMMLVGWILFTLQCLARFARDLAILRGGTSD